MPERLPEAHRRPEAQHSNLNLKDTLFPLFKHKWKIALCAMGGLIAATAVYFLWPPTYESDAVLLVRYVLERSAVDPEAGASVGSAATKTNDTFINAEVAILKSWDLATQVAEALGPKRVLPDAKGTPTVNDAAGAIFSGLDVGSTKNSNVILVSYSDRKPEVATLVLNELVNRYFTKHLEVHRSVGAFDFVSQQTDQVRARLNQTEDALKASKAKAGVLDIKDSTTSLAAEATKIEDELRVAEGDLAEQRARVKLMEGAGGVSSAPPSAPTATPATQPAPGATPAARPAPSATPATQPTNADIQQHQKLVALLDQLRHTELDLLSKYTSGSVQVKLTQSQIKELENQKQDLEKEFPSLAAAGPQAGEKAKLVGLEAKTEMLKAQLGDIQERIKQFADASPQIESLQRSKELEEANYKYFQGTLEKARVDEALDPSKMPNISAVQRPSPPSLVTKLRNKIALGLAGGAMALGVAFALLSELLFKQTLKRPLEVESRLGAPALLSIPDQTPRALPRPFKRWRKKLAVAARNGIRGSSAPG